jgi:hypothetical protein
MTRAFFPLFLGLALGLGGCKLIDQTTFGAKPRPPSPDTMQEALLPESHVPLVTIRFDGTDFPYDAQLAQAVDLAETRLTDPIYHIVTVVPATGNAASEAKEIEKRHYDLIRLRDALLADGVSEERIRVSARPEKGVTAPEIRIYVARNPAAEKKNAAAGGESGKTSSGGQASSAP